MKARRNDHAWACVLLSASFFALNAQAADLTAKGSGTHGVIMMIGGYANSESVEAEAASRPQALATDRQSVVIELAAARSADAAINPRVLSLAPLIADAARASGIDRALLMAVVDVESDGNPQAVSPKGASGLMQLMPATGTQHGATDLFDPRQNLAAGSRYLGRLIQQFGDLPLALAAYNAGETAIRRYGQQIPPYAEAMAYVPKVIERYRRYRSIAQ